MKKDTNKPTECWRLLDTPPMSAAENMCLDNVLAELKGEEQSPNTIRFLQFNPPTVLVGHHQFVEEEVRIDYCRDNDIDINRRITGGGAIYFDIGQLGWEIYASRSFFNLTFPVLSLYKQLCAPITKSLKELGLDKAAFRPRNDIEIEGRKISGTGGAIFGDSFIFQGTILIDFDIEAMLKALRVPTEKLKQKELNSIKERVTSVKRELGYLPDLANLKKIITNNFAENLRIKLEPAGLTTTEQELFDQKIDYFKSQEWINKVSKKMPTRDTIHSASKLNAGIVKFSLDINKTQKRIRDIYITGDFLCYPPRGIYDLEAELRGQKIEANTLQNIVKSYFDSGKITIPDMSYEDFITPLDNALAKANIFGLISPQNVDKVTAVNGTFMEILKDKPDHLLLPYCSKPNKCKLRHEKECESCSPETCSIGSAWQLGEKYNLSPTTITSYEALCEELQKMKDNGNSSFIGLCCGAFFTKHADDFKNFAVPGILLDINNTTCYELNKENAAHEGIFNGETRLDLELLQEVLKVMTDA